MAVIVHGLGMACLALRAGQACCRPVTLLSAEGAAAYAGVGWWRALVAAAHQAVPGCQLTDILDCGDAPGRALEALRAGQQTLVLRSGERVWADIAWRAQSCGAALLATAPAALDLGQPGAARRLSAWLARGARGAPTGVPTGASDTEEGIG